LNAIRFVDRMLRAAGASWTDLLVAQEQLAIATEAAAILKAELEQLRANGHLAPGFAEVGTITVSSTKNAAVWALDLHTQGKLWLSRFETDFLGTCAQWVGRLRPTQQPIFDKIITRVVERTGMLPPA
jgi:hypothetical protein